MSLQEDSCFSSCPFPNKDLRLPRQWRLRTRQGLLLKGASYRKDFLFFLFSFPSPLFQLYFCQALPPNNWSFIEKFPPGATQTLRRRSPSSRATAIFQCLAYSFQSKKRSTSSPCPCFGGCCVAFPPPRGLCPLCMSHLTALHPSSIAPRPLL